MTSGRHQWRLNAELSHALRFVARRDCRSERSLLIRVNGAMPRYPRKPDLSVVPMPLKTTEKCALQRDVPAATAAAAPGALASAGSPDDPRTQEAMRLVEAFLAIEDATARSSLIALAERLVSYDWLRQVQPR